MRHSALKRCLALACVLIGTLASKTAVGMPEVLGRHAQATGVPLESVGLWVGKADGSHVAAEYNADTLMQPASSIKVVTSLAALELLSPAYVWKTWVYLDRLPDADGTASGLSLRGGGDPHLVVERLWLIVERLSSLGVKRLEGDIVIDRGVFDTPPYEQGGFDGATLRSYNVGPDAMLTNFKSVSLRFTPNADGKSVRVAMTPRLSGVRLPELVKTAPGRCDDWKTMLKANFSDPTHLRFDGAYPAGCAERHWHVSRWERNDYFGRVFRTLFEQTGGVWNGTVKDGTIAADRRPIFSQDSEPLSHIADYVNKFSNNPMARQLFLTLSFADAHGMTRPASLERSRRVLSSWLRGKGVDPTRIVVDNGSGLSRETRASARALGRLMVEGYRSAVMPEFIGSLPMAGVDGTLKRRPLPQGSAHAKTGYLKNVRSLAGYITDTNGERWVVVVMINDERLEGGKSFIDGVVQWVASGAARSTGNP